MAISKPNENNTTNVTTEQVVPQTAPQVQPKNDLPNTLGYSNNQFANDFIQEAHANTNVFAEAFKSTVQESGLNALRDVLKSPINSGSVNERIAKIAEIFKGIYEEAKKTNPSSMDIEFILAPGNKIGNFYGGIVLAIPFVNADGSKVIGSHFVLVENGAKLNPQVENFNGAQYTIHNTPSNTVLEQTAIAIEKLVRAQFKSPEAPVLHGGFSIVPHELALTDESTLRQILDHAASMALTRYEVQLQSHETDTAVKLAEIITNNAIKVYANVETHPQDVTNMTQQPVKSDFKINVMAVEQAQQNQQQQDAVDLGTVNVFCTPVYAEPAGNRLPNGTHQLVTTQHYYNKIVVSDFKSGADTRLSIGGIFTLLATTGLLADGYWKQAYQPNRHIAKGDVDPRDIGAIGYEVPLTGDGKLSKLDTKTAQFDDRQFEEFMQIMFHQHQIYQVDVPEGHFLLSLLKAEADGSFDARTYLFNTINKMTGGKFGQIYDPNQQSMFINNGERVTVGYYPERLTKKLKSLDDYDHLAMLNLTNGESTAMLNFEKTMFPQQAQTVRIGLKTAIIEELSDHKAVFKSYSDRLTVNPHFMEALIRAFKEARLFPEVNNSLARTQAHVRQSADFYAQYAVNPQHLPNLLGGYQTNNPTFGNVQQASFGRMW